MRKTRPGDTVLTDIVFSSYSPHETNPSCGGTTVYDSRALVLAVVQVPVAGGYTENLLTVLVDGKVFYTWEYNTKR